MDELVIREANIVASLTYANSLQHAGVSQLTHHNLVIEYFRLLIKNMFAALVHMKLTQNCQHLYIKSNEHSLTLNSQLISVKN